MLHCVAACFSVLQMLLCVAVWSHASCDPILQHVANRYSTLQHVAVCCSVLQCVAPYCSMLQCVAPTGYLEKGKTSRIISYAVV